jgi:hypothetical protein
VEETPVPEVGLFGASPAALTRLSGWLYILATLGFIVASSIRSRVIAPNALATTAERMRESAGLARIGLVADVICVVLFLLTSIALYLLFVRVDSVAAALMVVFVTVGVPLGLLAIAQQLTALTIAVGASQGSVVGAASTDGSVGLLAASQASTRAIHDVIAGLWLLPLGYLVVISGYFPGVLGVLLVAGGIGWLLRLAVVVLAPELASIAALLALSGIAEVIFMIWLVTKGANVATG